MVKRIHLIDCRAPRPAAWRAVCAAAAARSMRNCRNGNRARRPDRTRIPDIRRGWAFYSGAGAASQRADFAPVRLSTAPNLLLC
jgi:hypothetical protein